MIYTQLLQSAIAAQTSRHMDSPYLSPHNIARLVDDIARRGHQGVPIVLAMDCTVVRDHNQKFHSRH